MGAQGTHAAGGVAITDRPIVGPHQSANIVAGAAYIDIACGIAAVD